MGIQPAFRKGRSNKAAFISVSPYYSLSESNTLLNQNRNVSAEIFVVCRDFLAPKKIDPKFLDPKHVFKELVASAPLDGKVSIAANAQANVFQPEKKRRHRDGYAEGDSTLFKAIGADEFIRSSDPISVLGSANRIAFVTEEEKE